MITGLLKKIFGNHNERPIKQYRYKVAQINALEPKFEAFTNAELQTKTEEFRQHFARDETLDAFLPEALAMCCEAGKCVMKMRHFDVQLINDMVLHDGEIAEMCAGEGKTLTAALAVYLDVVLDQSAHVVTVNDYLAQCDAEWMGHLYNWLGLPVGVNLITTDHDQKQGAYASDITYGINNEFGFDYLRNNIVCDVSQRVQRPLNYTIIDEVDSVLIDGARTPLIVPDQTGDRTGLCRHTNSIPVQLTRQIGEEKSDSTGVEKSGDYYVGEKLYQVYLTESGHKRAEHILLQAGLIGENESLYAPQSITLMHHLCAALRAHGLFFRDQHYVMQNGGVVVVGESTDRLMAGRRWSDGLYQVVEAEEGVQIQQGNQTLATITFRNYFRIYNRLSGMTGTAGTEAYEFQGIHGPETVVILTSRTP